MADPLKAFDVERSAFADAISSLSAADVDRQTNCAPWNLHELVVHVIISIRLPDSVVPATGALPEATAADYFRRAERGTEEYRGANVDRTQTIAASIDGPNLHRLFVDTSKRTAAVAAEKGLDFQLEAGGRTHTFASYMLTRIISVAAHGVDVAITLDRKPWTTPSALAAIRPVLVDLLGADPPPAWNDQNLLELGTGRRALSAWDMEKLGELGNRFPLLS